MTHSNVKARLLPFSVIQKAAGGDVEAINAVLKHYEGYIARLSLRELYDEYGNPHFSRAFKKITGLPPTEWRTEHGI